MDTLRKNRSVLILIVFALSAVVACGQTPATEEAESPSTVAESPSTVAESPSTVAESPSTSESPERALRPIRYALATVSVIPTQASYSSIPVELGYWEDEGLDVEILTFEGASATAQALDAGQVDTATIDTVPLFLANSTERGTENMIAYYAYIPYEYSTMTVPDDSPIQTPADIEGKRVGVASLGNSQVAVVNAAVLEDGGDPGSITFVAVGQGPTAAAALEEGRIDVLALWDGSDAAVRNLVPNLRGIESDYISSLGFAGIIAAKESTLVDRREDLIGIVRGIAKASVFAQENPEAAVRIHWKQYPASKPVGVSEEEAMEQALTTLMARIPNMGPVDDVWGLVTETQVENRMQFLLDSGFIETTLDIDEIWTPDLLEEANDFDEEAIREQARNYEG